MLRPKKLPPEEKPFERRSRPTPQATRLLFTSTLAGLGLVLVLAVVFIPRGLQEEGQPDAPVLYLDVVPPLPVPTILPYTVNVTLVSLHLPLSDFEVELTHPSDVLLNRTAIPDLVPPVAFVDSDGDAHLSVGDSFVVSAWETSMRLFVYHVPSGDRIGFTTLP